MTSRLPFLSFRLLNEKNTANYGDSAARAVKQKNLANFAKKRKNNEAFEDLNEIYMY